MGDGGQGHRDQAEWWRVTDNRFATQASRLDQTVAQAHRLLQPRQHGVYVLLDLDCASAEMVVSSAPTLEEFLSGLRTAWREGEVRPTSRPKEKAKRGGRRPDPLVAVTAGLQGWFEAEPWRTARELLERLQGEQPGTYPVRLLRTLQRRLKAWRRDKAHELVFGATPAGVEPASAALDSVT